MIGCAKEMKSKFALWVARRFSALNLFRTTFWCGLSLGRHRCQDWTIMGSTSGCRFCREVNLCQVRSRSRSQLVSMIVPLRPASRGPVFEGDEILRGQRAGSPMFWGEVEFPISVRGSYSTVKLCGHPWGQLWCALPRLRHHLRGPDHPLGRGRTGGPDIPSRRPGLLLCQSGVSVRRKIGVSREAEGY